MKIASRVLWRDRLFFDSFAMLNYNGFSERSMKSASRLIVFRISHYCEKVRWALDRIGFPYVEECHLPPLHRLKTTPLGGSSVPILITESEILKDSADILKYKVSQLTM